MIVCKDGRHYVVFLMDEGAHLMPAFWYWWNDPLWDMATVFGRMPSLNETPALTVDKLDKLT